MSAEFISHVRVDPGVGEHVIAFATVTLADWWVVHDLRLVRTPRGPLVACPARPATCDCPNCTHRNPVRSRYCNRCGVPIPAHVSAVPLVNGVPRGHFDLAHPAGVPARRELDDAVREAVLAAGIDVGS